MGIQYQVKSLVLTWLNLWLAIVHITVWKFAVGECVGLVLGIKSGDKTFKKFNILIW